MYEQYKEDPAMLDNYPPGFDPSSLDDPTEGLELSDEQMAVKYTLRVECGEYEEQVFESSWHSEEAMLEDLRKVDYAVEQWRDMELKHQINRLGDGQEEA